MLLALYRLTGRSELTGGDQWTVTATLPSSIIVSPSVMLLGGSGLCGSAHNDFIITTNETSSTANRLFRAPKLLMLQYLYIICVTIRSIRHKQDNSVMDKGVDIERVNTRSVKKRVEQWNSFSHRDHCYCHNMSAVWVVSSHKCTVISHHGTHISNTTIHCYPYIMH